MKIAVIGAGFVGLTTACVLASRGHSVVLIDHDKEKIAGIRAGIVPFFEVGLSDLLLDVNRSGKLQSSTWDCDDLKFADLVLLCVGTPSNPDGSINLFFIKDAIDKCNLIFSGMQIVAIKSTIIPGTTRKLQEELKNKGSHLRLAMIPEFLREGSALQDASYPDRLVIGTSDLEVAAMLKSVFGVSNVETIITTTLSAESIKYFSNVFLATCISITNELFEFIDGDNDCRVVDILNGWHTDRRFRMNNGEVAAITNYLIPGPGFGGSCFPKDLRALYAGVGTSSNNREILRAVLERNASMPAHTSKWISENVPKSETILIMGLSFKEETDDFRESPAISLYYELESAGYLVQWLDKRISRNAKGLPEYRVEMLQELRSNFIVLSNHDVAYREILTQNSRSNLSEPRTVFALRLQNPIAGYKWLIPRQGAE